MTTRTHRFIPGLPAALVLAAAFLCGGAVADAETVVYSADVGGEPARAVVEVVPAAEMRLVSLGSLVGQFGGRIELLSSRVEVDLGGRTAWVERDGTRVDASLAAFSLNHPVRVREGEALISVDDVERFFRQAFRVEVSAGTDTSASRAAPRPAVTMEDLEEPLDVAPREPRAPTATRHAIGTIVVDPGHGGNDPGCEGPDGLLEKDVTLATAHLLKRHLENLTGATVFLTRDGDTDLALDERANAANVRRADLLISIHTGASLSRTAHGFELFWADDTRILPGIGRRGPRPVPDQGARGEYILRSRALAGYLAESIAAATSAAHRGSHETASRLLRGVAMPGILVEIGCITSASEEGLLETEAYRDRVATGIAEGVHAYMQSNRDDGT